MKKLNPYLAMIALAAVILIQPLALQAGASLSTTPPQAAPQSPVFGDIVAHYPLTSDLNDATGRNAPMVTKGVSFDNGAILSNGVYENDEASTPPLQTMNHDRFAIRAQFLVTEAMDKTRPVFVVGYGSRWLGFLLDKNGTITMLVENNNFVSSNLTYKIGTWHEAIMTYDRSQQQANIYLDGRLACTFNRLNHRNENSVMITNFSNGSTFRGWIKNLTIGTGSNTNNNNNNNTNAAPTNVALRKPTEQSTTIAEACNPTADKAVDGNTDGTYGNCSVSHTNLENRPWWRVDLQRDYNIARIELYNRTDCCGERLSNFDVLISRDKINWTPFAFPGTVSSGQNFTINAPARYVQVMMRGTGILSLAEVAVFATAAAVAPPPPQTPQITRNPLFNERSVVGNYERRPVENGWHDGTIQSVGNALRWVNKAGGAWTLIPDYINGVLRTQNDNPYQSTGPRDFAVLMNQGQVTGFKFGDEVYTKVASAAPPNFLSNIVGTQWVCNYMSNEIQFVFGQTTIDTLSQGWWPGVTWTITAPNNIRFWDPRNNRAMTIRFDSPTSFTGTGFDGSVVTGHRRAAPVSQPQPQLLTRPQLEEEFRTCAEAQQHGPSTDMDFTVSLFWRYLSHGPDGMIQYHAGRLTNSQITRGQLEEEFRTCAEAQQHGPSTNMDFTVSLFWRYLGHGPDGMLQYHVGRLK